MRTLLVVFVGGAMLSRDRKSDEIKEFKGNPFIRDDDIWDREHPSWDKCKVGSSKVQ